MQLSLSIALATYNGERYLREQLDSIARQTRLPEELVIFDDASVDSTSVIVRDFARCAPFVVRFHKNSERLGSTRNFEAAIRACNGDIIFLCDQDDVWYQDKMVLIEACFTNDPGTGAVFTNADVVDQNLHSMGLRLWSAKTVRFTPKEQVQVAVGDAFGVLLKHCAVTGATMAFRSTYRNLVLPMSDIWVHDAWMAILIAATSKLIALPMPLIAYRQHSANQIGITHVRNPDRACAAIYGPQVLRYEAVRKRLLESVDCFPPGERNIHRLDEALVFLRARAALPSDHWRRLPGTLHELMTLRYHCYADGFRSFRKDLLR
jgi:glycosyltransferase involved in cell wall biosynthesis